MIKLKLYLKRVLTLLVKKQPLTRQHAECVIIGSGPSIDNLNVNHPYFKNRDVYGCNFVPNHERLSRLTFNANFIIDREYTKELPKYRHMMPKYTIISTKNQDLLPLKLLLSKTTLVVRTRAFDPEKSHAMKGHYLTGNVVPFMITYLSSLGYTRIHLLGVDHYDIKSLKNTNFHNYIGRKIKTSITPEKIKYIEQFFEYLKYDLESKNIIIENCTPNTRLQTFKNRIIPGLHD